MFLDGTGNNKYQVTMGKLFRLKEALAKAEGKKEVQVSISNAHDKGRAYWEMKSDLSQSQLDELFFCYEEAGKDSNFVEQRVDSVHTAEQIGPHNAEALKLRTYKQAAKEFHRKADRTAMSDTDWKQLNKATTQTVYRPNGDCPWLCVA